MRYDKATGGGALYCGWPRERQGPDRDDLERARLEPGRDGRCTTSIRRSSGSTRSSSTRADGSLGTRRPLVTIDPADGNPDGLTVDAEGHIWLALWRGWSGPALLARGPLRAGNPPADGPRDQRRLWRSEPRRGGHHLGEREAGRSRTGGPARGRRPVPLSARRARPAGQHLRGLADPSPRPRQGRVALRRALEVA